MHLPAKAKQVEITSPLSQGDVYRDIPYFSLQEIDNDQVEVKEYIYPQVIIISQACDTYWMNDMFERKTGITAKYMPMILLCPIFHTEALTSGTFISNIAINDGIAIDNTSDHIYKKEERKVTERDFHYRFHNFNVELGNKPVSENYVVDFKQCFSIPFSYLYSKRDSRLFRLDLCYAQQITQKFCNYLSRMGFDDG